MENETVLQSKTRLVVYNQILRPNAFFNELGLAEIYQVEGFPFYHYREAFSNPIIPFQPSGISDEDIVSDVPTVYMHITSAGQTEFFLQSDWFECVCTVTSETQLKKYAINWINTDLEGYESFEISSFETQIKKPVNKVLIAMYYLVIQLVYRFNLCNTSKELAKEKLGKRELIIDALLLFPQLF